MKYTLKKLSEISPFYQYNLRGVILDENDAPMYLVYSLELGKLLERFLNQPIIGEIIEERKRQDEQWGGPEDNFLDWVNAIDYQLIRWENEQANEREVMIKIAALAVAAVQSLDASRQKESNDKTTGSDGLPGSDDR